MNVSYYLRDKAISHPDNVFINDMERDFTFSEIEMLQSISKFLFQKASKRAIELFFNCIILSILLFYTVQLSD